MSECNTLLAIRLIMNSLRFHFQGSSSLKAANVTEATNIGIHTNPMPQDPGRQVTQYLDN